ncbi:MAG: hypothetical protein ACK4NY_22530 [Spirosomataceae bacterium]
METKTKTYGGKIQEMIAAINKIHDDAEWMRDLALGNEKIYWNRLREITYSLDRPLKDMLDNMSDEDFNRNL